VVRISKKKGLKSRSATGGKKIKRGYFPHSPSLPDAHPKKVAFQVLTSSEEKKRETTLRGHGHGKRKTQHDEGGAGERAVPK